MRLEIAQHRIQRALLAAQHTLARLVELLGDLVAVHRRPRAREHRQQHQRNDAGAELLVEFPQMRLGSPTAVAHLPI